MDTFPQLEHWFEHRVSYGETDCMGYVYYAEYFHIFERGRSEFIRSRGKSYTYVEEHGIFLPVREARCRYRMPARYDYLLRVRTGIAELGRASVTFAYEVRHDGDLLSTGMTQHACVNASGSPVAMPAWLRNLIVNGACD